MYWAFFHININLLIEIKKEKNNSVLSTVNCLRYFCFAKCGGDKKWNKSERSKRRSHKKCALAIKGLNWITERVNMSRLSLAKLQPICTLGARRSAATIQYSHLAERRLSSGGTSKLIKFFTILFVESTFSTNTTLRN